jgi:hypothetical protein
MIKCIAFSPEHAFAILEANEGSGVILPMNKDDMVLSYVTPGSIAMTMIINDQPMACGGVINMAWHRGEAWILTRSGFRIGKKTWPMIKSIFSIMAAIRGFVRVQATAYDPKGCLFKHLGFEFEGKMRKFGPSGETGYLFSRIFEDRSAQ